MKEEPFTKGRSKARFHAFVLIYQMSFYSNDIESLAAAKAEYYAYLGRSNMPSKRYHEYIDRVTWAVAEKCETIDAILENYAENWDISRIDKIDLAILRLAVHEIFAEEDVPPGVAVNEAVELAKIYGSDNSPRFVNGVLGKMKRERLNV